MDVRAALVEETAAFGDLIRTADPTTPVPTCPEWTIRQLFRHVGRGNRWAAQIVADQREGGAGLDRERHVEHGVEETIPDAQQLGLDRPDRLEAHMQPVDLEQRAHGVTRWQRADCVVPTG